MDLCTYTTMSVTPLNKTNRQVDIPYKPLLFDAQPLSLIVAYCDATYCHHFGFHEMRLVPVKECNSPIEPPLIVIADCAMARRQQMTHFHY